MPTLNRQSAIEKARARGEDPDQPDDHGAQLRAAVEQHPHQPNLVLPTRFGNRFRAFEVYSEVVYGIDAIPLWPRLQAILPAEFRDLLNGAKSRLDFFVNLLLTGVLTLLVFALGSAWTGTVPSTAPVIAGLTLVIFGYKLASAAASEFGIYVKSGFDLYRGELAAQLGMRLPLDPAEEREMWDRLSRMMIYRSAERYDELKDYRANKTKSGGSKPSTP